MIKEGREICQKKKRERRRNNKCDRRRRGGSNSNTRNRDDRSNRRNSGSQNIRRTRFKNVENNKISSKSDKKDDDLRYFHSKDDNEELTCLYDHINTIAEEESFIIKDETNGDFTTHGTSSVCKMVVLLVWYRRVIE